MKLTVPVGVPVDEAARSVSVKGTPENGDRFGEVSTTVVGAFPIVTSPEPSASATV
ncbi:hypothetical protein RBB77_02710 [Tunturibacter psychrotolerans]|uniref:Uncharacterized protein n=1 Tax=Tunturiibacter psychrotolerans TaxID=3069686 RepID=A0AAU7ZSB3_9BACT